MGPIIQTATARAGSLVRSKTGVETAGSVTPPAPPPRAPATPPPATTVPQTVIPAAYLLTRLRDPASIREAIILREVLGPPKAFQPLTGWGRAD